VRHGQRRTGRHRYRDAARQHRTEAPPPPHPTSTTGTTEDGETIVFASAHPQSATPDEHPIDREHLIMTPNAPDPNATWTLDDALAACRSTAISSRRSRPTWAC